MPVFLQEDAEQSEHCDCGDRAPEKNTAHKGTALVQVEHKAAALDAVLDAVLPVTVQAVQEQLHSSASVELKSLKQAESTLEREEAEIHRQMMLLQQRVQQAEQSEQVQQPPLQQLPQQWQNSFPAQQAPQQWQSMLQMPQSPQQPWQNMPQNPQAWAMPQAVYPQMPMQVQGFPGAGVQPQPQMAGGWPMMPNYAQMMPASMQPAPMQYGGFR